MMTKHVHSVVCNWTTVATHLLCVRVCAHIRMFAPAELWSFYCIRGSFAGQNALSVTHKGVKGGRRREKVLQIVL